MRQRSFLNASLAVLAPAILALAVSACAQDYAGITRAEVTFEDGALAAVSFIGGKEPGACAGCCAAPTASPPITRPMICAPSTGRRCAPGARHPGRRRRQRRGAPGRRDYSPFTAMSVMP